jgi:PcfJ-like protein
MADTTGRILLHIKYLDDEAAGQPTGQGTVSGAALRIVARTAPDGRPSVAATVSYRVHRRRASGKVFRYWTLERATSLARTKQDLVVLRTLDRRRAKCTTVHVFDDDQQIGFWLNRLRLQLMQPLHGTRPNRLRIVEGPVPWAESITAIADQTAEALQPVRDEIYEHIGELPSAKDRFPLVREVHRTVLGHTGQIFALDAENYRQIAENAFGKTRYRRPLAREVERMDGDWGMLNWFRLFRGLVPIDWIIDSMRRTPAGTRQMLEPADLCEARRLLLRVPQPVLRRILTEDARVTMRMMQDTARVIGSPELRWRDLDLLPRLITARGQNRIRGMQDLETLVRGMPDTRLASTAYKRSISAGSTMLRESREHREMQNYNEAIAYLPDTRAEPATWQQWQDPAFRERADRLIADRRRELMDARQREQEERTERYHRERLEREAERAAWAARTTTLLDGMAIRDLGLRIVVAHNAETLAQWGASLNNCIAGYAYELGLDVFAAVIDSEGRTRLNVQIQMEEGITQFLGNYNRDAVKELPDEAQAVLDAFVDAGIAVQEHALGLSGLSVKGHTATAA